VTAAAADSQSILKSVAFLNPSVLAATASASPSAQTPPEPTAIPASPGSVQLTFEHYVVLCAQLTVFPDRSAQIAAHVGLSEATMNALHAEWRTRFAADDSLSQKWHRLYAHYCDWYTKNKGP
jgi:hypothetical protein